MTVRNLLLMEENFDVFGYEEIERAFKKRDASIKAKIRRFFRKVFWFFYE